MEADAKLANAELLLCSGEHGAGSVQDFGFWGSELEVGGMMEFREKEVVGQSVRI